MSPTITTLSRVCYPAQYGANAKGATEPIGPKFVRQTDIQDGRIDWSSVPYCTLPEDEVAKYTLERGDLLISRLGNGVGNAAMVQEPNDAIFAGYLVRFKTIEDVALPTFISYQLQSPAWRSHVNNFGSGAAQPTLNAKQMGEFAFELPSLAEQERIGNVLSSLDGKIDSNRRTQQLLDELFQAQWLDFYNSQLDSEEVQLSEIVQTQYGLGSSASFAPVGPKFLRVTDMNKRNWIDWSDVPYVQVTPDEHKKYSLKRGDLLVARMADPGKSAIYEDTSVDAIFAGYLVRLIPKSYEHALFIYGFLKSAHFVQYAHGSSSGSVQKNMNAKVISAVKLRVPKEEQIVEFSRKVMPLRERLTASLAETAKLRELRNALIPELLSRRVHVGKG